MLSDRPYMQGDYPRRTTSVVIWLVSALVAAFVIELVLLSPWLGGSGAAVMRYLPLTIEGLRSGYVWTLFTHSLLHSTDNPFHILFTIAGLIFLGRELEAVLGPRRLLAVFAAGIITGGLAWAAVNWVHGGVQIGAGSAILAFLAVLAGLNPNTEMSLFFFPITFRIRHFVYAILAIDVLGLLFYEISGARSPLGLTPSAHLGGMLAGWLYFRFFHAGNGWDRAPGLALPAWLRWPRRSAKATVAATPEPGRTRRASPELRAEVDRILDKINSHGFGALTDDEKRVLDEAKDLLSRR
jgi:membrane associated rhomboid family serine protease